MAEKGGPFEVHPTVKQAMEHASGGMDQYFDFLKKNLASIPTGGTELAGIMQRFELRAGCGAVFG